MGDQERGYQTLTICISKINTGEIRKPPAVSKDANHILTAGGFLISPVFILDKIGRASCRERV